MRVRLSENELTRRGQNYLFGVNVLGRTAMRGALPSGSVIINSEPMARPEQVAGAVDFKDYLPLLNGMHVWDYSKRNIEAFERSAVGAISYAWVPIGFSEHSVSPLIKIGGKQDIDVLFYGRVNARRAHVLDKCRGAGLNVVSVDSSCFGDERAALIARSKLVLNVGWVEDSVFEQYRVSYLMNNRKAVVTEMHPDERLPEDFVSALAIAQYENIAETCVRVVKDDAWRGRLEAAAPEALRLPVFAQTLDAALANVLPKADES
jgi:hypothetical protein